MRDFEKKKTVTVGPARSTWRRPALEAVDLVIGLCVVALCAPASASATVYTVNTTDDHNDQPCTPAIARCVTRWPSPARQTRCTCRQGTYVLTQSLGELALVGDTIVGANARTTIIRAGTQRRVIGVTRTPPSEISRVTITGGNPVAAARLCKPVAGS